MYAGVAQLVEYLLPKQDVAGSNPVARSIDLLLIKPELSNPPLRAGRPIRLWKLFPLEFQKGGLAP
jgi:hypothetical protein